MSLDHTIDAGLDYRQICAFLYREARLLDDRQWDEWLECYAPDASYWMPAWDDNDQITEILRLVAFDPTFLRTLVEVEDPSGVMRFAAYIDAGGVNASKPQIVEWRQVDEEEAAALLLSGPTENDASGGLGRSSTRGNGGVGQGRPTGAGREQR